MQTKNIFITLLVSLISFTGFSQFDISLTIKNISSNEGELIIGLYNTNESFLKKPFKYIILDAQKGTLQTSFKGIPAGAYAISLFHDLDNDRKLTTNFLGIPKEKYGTSNDAKGMFGPPKWEDAKFTILDQNISQTINL